MLPVAAIIAQASPSPSPSPSPAPRFEIHGSGSNVFIDQATSGVGRTPPEGPAFINGNPAAPLTPFDWFSAQPLLPGVAGQVQWAATGTYHAKTINASATVLLSVIDGDPTNATYLGEPLVGFFDPQEGRARYTVPVAYPTHAGTYDVGAGALVIPYNVSLGASDDRWHASAGFVQTTQYDSFVFAQPPFTTWTPSMNVQTFETLGPGLSDLSSWSHFAPAIPVLGFDANAKAGNVTVEITDGLLPAPRTSSARMLGANAVLDRGDAGRYSVGIINASSRGDALGVPTIFGSNPQLFTGPQGKLAFSTLGNQNDTVAGARAFVHPRPGYDLTLELGRSWYRAAQVAHPGTEAPGDFQHYAFDRHFNASSDAGIEYYRMSARYGSMLLPYGIFDNVLGIAWFYPGPWLKGSYQLVNNAWGGSNREGLREHASFTKGPWTVAGAIYDYRQIEPSTQSNLESAGFVEVDYLVLDPHNGTHVGHTRGAQFYAAWKGSADTLSFDYANDSQHRDFDTPFPEDGVDMRYPQLVVAEQHQVRKGLSLTGGYGRYHASGTWAGTPVGDTYGMGFLGGQIDLGPHQQLFVQLRRYGTFGAPSQPGGPPPTFTGTQFLVDHHFSF